MLHVATIAAIVDQHAEDAAFLWLRRRREIDGPLLDETEIGRIDQRLEANIEGLMAAGKAGWEAALARFGDYPEPGELFVLGALALRWGEAALVASAIEAAIGVGKTGLSPLSAAIARAPRDNLRPFVAKWLDARDAWPRALGLSALWHHRVDPGSRLFDLAGHSDAVVRGHALRLAGALKRRDLLPMVLAGLDAETPGERLTAAVAACMLGETRSAHRVIDQIVMTEPGLAEAAIEIRLLTTPTKAGKQWLRKHLAQPARRVAATASIGLFGDHKVMPWLIEKMREPDLAGAAGASLRDLFEVDFGDTDLFVADTSLLGKDFADLDDGLLPAADRVEAWWDEGRGGRNHRLFRSMRRLRLGALRAAFAAPETPLADWRGTRSFPAWI
ncbi:MAG: hypothetical protein E5V91_23370 [Mesorhizobium sp.]|uniref:hypothetical protein n=1 Tax=unclassified Mesorhizobium TaxID=325217 RepID=UPI000FCC8269|nr:MULTISPECIES: hypothetical protein [unclassified Mesorhizobium]RUW39483.1 hypothetical protein EOA37_19545 [Mesorhizobium sp. M2A.F.Ca.ET.015.02.1.1]RVC96960.1 hypothetical protein EN739_06510 [Mesorhizobium sp. M2A.F.Ca.ET.017.03.2.1]RVD10219.1 hypothetical protein EN753_07180 [Mesorhizobium sp. M2A.F.Ca.ET.029.05.1.1]RWB49229.1 MAG: hypothetical protein EOQ46_02685 [Mesorhizobium sp.]RWB64546.1 MAG: hypothetical protein EOQ48_02735 [Mesorhizobium sp.]